MHEYTSNQISIGSICDWIENNMKHRGLCIDLVNSHALMVVVGSGRVHTIHVGSLLLHKEHKYFIDLCRDESK